MAKLDANESALGPFPGVAAAIAAAAEHVNRYPDQGLALVEAIARRHAVDTADVLVGNGADAIIGYLCEAFAEPGDEVVMASPSFVTYAQDAMRRGASPVEVPVRADGRLDLDAMLAAITGRTRIVFVCNPNNPTGGWLPRDEVDRFLAAVPSDVVAVVDQAYAEYVGDEPDDVAPLDVSRPNVCYLRSFSKIFGLAGLRVGYAVGPAAVLEPLRRSRHWYDVADVSHVAATASLGQPDELARRRAAAAADRADLEGLLRERGFDPLPSAAGFVLVPVRDAAALASALEEDGVLVRPVAADGREFIRIAAGDADDRSQLAAALDRIARA